mmetsp:Transcript_8160/g.14470  ORF Transcript_8160/g.14470 Transcript_8160/m.14470 type:complete len:81 (+) Transcript_8160:706-948(+)
MDDFLHLGNRLVRKVIRGHVSTRPHPSSKANVARLGSEASHEASPVFQHRLTLCPMPMEALQYPAMQARLARQSGYSCER